MDSTSQLKKFAEDREKEARNKLTEIIQEIEKEIEGCKELDGLELIPSENITADNAKTADEIYYQNTSEVLKTYKELLDDAKEAGIRLKFILPLNLTNVETGGTDLTVFKKLIETAYGDIVGNFETICNDIISFCRVLLTISESSRQLALTEGADAENNDARILICLYTKIVLPIEKAVFILAEVVTQKETLDSSSSDPNNETPADSNALPHLVKILINLDCQFRLNQLNFMEIENTGYNLGPDFRSKVDKLMLQYHIIFCNYNVSLMLYQLSQDHLQLNVSREKLKIYKADLLDLVKIFKEYFVEGLDIIKESFGTSINK